MLQCYSLEVQRPTSPSMPERLISKYSLPHGYIGNWCIVRDQSLITGTGGGGGAGLKNWGNCRSETFASPSEIG